MIYLILIQPLRSLNDIIVRYVDYRQSEFISIIEIHRLHYLCLDSWSFLCNKIRINNTSQKSEFIFVMHVPFLMRVVILYIR
jgi:hypothetical protein